MIVGAKKRQYKKNVLEECIIVNVRQCTKNFEVFYYVLLSVLLCFTKCFTKCFTVYYLVFYCVLLSVLLCFTKCVTVFY